MPKKLPRQRKKSVEKTARQTRRVDVSDLLKKHEGDLLKHDFKKFYDDLRNSDFDIYDHEALSRSIMKYRQMERKEYDMLRKKHKKLSFSEEEIPIAKVFELIVREHLLKKVKPKVANQMRNYIHEREKMLSKNIAGKEATIHESPEDYAEAEMEYTRKISESYDNYKRINENLDKKGVELAEKFVEEIGVGEAEESIAKLSSAMSDQKELHDAMLSHPRPVISEIDVGHHVEKHMKSFHDKLIKPFEKIIERKRKKK